MQTYTITQIRQGTGWARKQEFVAVEDVTAMRTLMEELAYYAAIMSNLSATAKGKELLMRAASLLETERGVPCAKSSTA